MQITTPLVIKLGGAALDNPENLNQFLAALASCRASLSRPLVLVHGGGSLVDKLLHDLNLKSEKCQGLRVTSPEQINYVVGALAGTANKLLQASALKAGIASVGLCLADAGLCKVQQKNAALGCVGDVVANDASLLHTLLAANYLPIISSIGIDEAGLLMNVNADEAAVAIASLLNAELALLCDVSGVLNGKGKLVTELSQQTAADMIATGMINAGMKVKVDAAFAAVEALGRKVQIASWRYPEKLTQLFRGELVGTCCYPKNID